jgi:hypothetical protein
VVFLVTSKRGVAEALRLSREEKLILWVAHGVLTDAEAASLRANGHDVTVWSRPENTSYSWLQSSVATIEEHHPGHTIWVECTGADEP